jgi:hypothetical protein
MCARRKAFRRGRASDGRPEVGFGLRIFILYAGYICGGAEIAWLGGAMEVLVIRSMTIDKTYL